MRRRRSGILAVLLLGAALARAGAETSPFPNLDAAQSAAILRGESVFRECRSWRELAVPADAPFAAALIAETKASGANYLGEVLMLLPAAAPAGGAATAAPLPLRLASLLSKVEGYGAIPYWSKRNNVRTPLFRKNLVLSRSGSEAAGTVLAEQNMEPFSDYRARYTWSGTATALSFSSVNESPLSYKGTQAVSPGAMVWRLEAWRRGEQWVLYGQGRVKAFDMFGLLRERLSLSFMGRIEAYFTHMFAQLGRGTS